MSWEEGIVTIVVMFVVRLGVPLAITFGLGYALHRLDVRWQAQLSAA